jgi:two-component system nitrate/nitrite sensor histidine kinase NarX
MNEIQDIGQPGRLRTLLAKLIRPADDWAHVGRDRRRSALLVLMVIVLATLLLAAIAVIGLAQGGDDSELLLGIVLALLGIAALIVALLMYQVRYHLLEPLAELYAWALRMCDGDLSARIPTPQAGRFAKLTYHINRLSEALEKLANEMDDAVWAQTERLQQKNQSLETLYEIASTINTCDDLEELLQRATEKLMNTINGNAAVIRLRDDDGIMTISERIGLGSRDVPRIGKRTPEEIALSNLDQSLESGEPSEEVEVHRASMDGVETAVAIIPLHYHHQVLGVVSLYTRSAGDAENSEVLKLFTNVGKHLGMAIAKDRLDEETRNLSLMRERNSLAHELHDSLAQTLAGIKFQVQMLAETLERVDAPAARRETVRIRNSLDEANTELRELIANFRSPVDAKGVIPALEELTARFRKESGIATYLQVECPDLQLSPVSELQVLRIVREALNNARKHSQAQTVRVLVRCDHDGVHRILVEDDGVGLGERAPEENPGEHLGLSIMQERARRIRGLLKIESEPGEGTQVVLSFRTETTENHGELERHVS